MKPAKFEYHAPASVDEALAILSRYDGEARVLAGGQSLVPMMNFRLATPRAIIDLNRIAGLAYVEEEGEIVRIGSMTRQRRLEFDPLVAAKLPLLREALRWVGHLPTRSRGTIGGSIAHADPSAEIPMVLQTLEGEVVARGPQGERRMAAQDLFRSGADHQPRSARDHHRGAVSGDAGASGLCASRSSPDAREISRSPRSR